MKKLMSVFIITLFLSGLCMSVSSVSAAKEDIQILSYSWYVPQNYGYYAMPGNLVVVGEIQNVGSSVIDFVRLEGIAYTTDGEPQAAAYSIAFVNNLLPQQKAPFYMLFNEMSTLSGNLTWIPLLDHVSFRVILADETDVRQYDGLKIVANTSYVDNNGYYNVVGYLQNVGSQQSGKVWVTGTFYNATGAVIGTGFTNYLANYTAPNESIQFSLKPLDVTPEMSAQIASYSLLIQSREPEPTPSPTPAATGTPSGSTNESPSATPQPTQSTGSATSSSTLVTAVVAIAVVVVVVVIAVVVVKRKAKHQ
ncbi:MAG: FxLYD domain-containing protein [Candidatus Bathyarchaeota archaeon]|nr:FxLYD domain-containing protein [Candidatus Bathyarchaeota archaeon]